MENEKIISWAAIRRIEEIDKSRQNAVQEVVTLMLDPDVIDWLKTKGPDFELLINKLLRAEMIREALSIGEDTTEWEKKMQEINDEIQP